MRLAGYTNCLMYRRGFMNRSRGARAAITVAAVATNLATGLATGSAYAADDSGAGSLQLEAAFQDLIDVDRVEVLRGPQSTLFGKSAIAGVLNITTAAPTRERTGKASILATNDSEKRGSFTVSGPLSDTSTVELRSRATSTPSHTLRSFGSLLPMTRA
jgi:outer membrane receptor protein involved in Fe transport